MKILLLVAVVTMMAMGSSIEKAPEVVMVSVYYDSLCSSSNNFIIKQLYPAYKKLGSALLVDLVPYAKVFKYKYGDDWVYQCHEGGRECIGNILQACGFDKVEDQDKQVAFANCYAKQNLEGGVTNPEKCPSELGLTYKELRNCTYSSKGLELFEELGNIKEGFAQLRRNTPWILFNDIYDETLANAAEKNLLEVACKLLDNKPPGCAKAEI